MTTTRQYDNFNRLTSVSVDPSGAGEPNISYGYAYNSAHQRTQATLEDGSYWVYQYDALGQVVSGKRFWSDGTPVAGQQYEYGFDDIGNREAARKGGNEFGVGLRTEGYTANNLNQYTGRTVPGTVDVIGEANSGATVTVNTRSTSRKGSYFRAELFTDNGGSLQYLSLTNHAVLNDGPDITNSVLGELLIPASPEVFFHDADGNLLRDGLWTNTWDHENRLIATESVPDVPVVAKRKLEFVYDYMGRRISKTVSTNSGSGWVEQFQRKFVYDGWNVIAELDGEGSLVSTYLWGLDLSGSEQGAGGVGGLLVVGGEHLAAYDGNGNVVGLVSSIHGTRSAEYEYDPFGGTLRATGVASESNPFRFSTKYTDDETGLLYYGHRYYNPSTGRWLSRDPIGERGGLNPYEFVNNSSVDKWDVLGLYTLGDAVGSLKAKGVVPEIPAQTIGSDSSGIDVGGGGTVSVTVPGKYSDQQMFDEWYQLEKARGPWWTSLPKCPKRLCIRVQALTKAWVGIGISVGGGSVQAVNSFAKDPSKWGEPGRPRNAEANLHPGTVWSLRSKPDGTGHGNQCTYDAAGKLIRTPPGAGTVDWYLPGPSLNHYNNDVAPVYVANKLDGGESMGLVSSTVTGGPFILSTPGKNMNHYYEVRPLWAEDE